MGKNTHKIQSNERGLKQFKRWSLCLLSICFIVQMFSIGNAFAEKKTIGIIMTGKIPYYEDIHKAFINTISQEAFVREGEAEIIVQKPGPNPMSWANAARKLVVLESDVIVSYGAPATLTVSEETSKIPIVFAAVYDPEGLKIVKKNMSGISSKIPVSGIIKNLKEIATFSKLGVIYNSDEKDTVLQAQEVKKLEGKYGFKSVLFNIKRKGDARKIKNVEALFLTTSCSAMQCVENIVGLARKNKLPTATAIGGGEERGIILTIAADPTEQGSKVAQLVKKVIQGTKPSALPVKQPKKVYMVVNLKEANALGLKVPFGLLTSATRVIK